MALFGSLAMIRLQADASATPLAQRFADRLFRLFDAGLREAGVGDLSVPKRIRGLAGAFYGRLQATRPRLRPNEATNLLMQSGVMFSPAKRMPPRALSRITC
jgi:cytochrome b pre-mRNA-processing protein 3